MGGCISGAPPPSALAKQSFPISMFLGVLLLVDVNKKWMPRCREVQLVVHLALVPGYQQEAPDQLLASDRD